MSFRAALAALTLLGAEAEAADPPSRSYYLYVCAESDDTVHKIRFGPNGFEELREISVGSGNLGPFSARIEIDPSEGPISMLWLDRAFTTGDILDYAAIATTDESGYGQLDVNVTTSGYYCLVLYREGSHIASKTSPAMSIALRTGATPPNLRTHNELAGWAAPLVPRPIADGTPASVPAPTLLHGDLASTYLNLASINDGSIAAAATSGAALVDGLSLTSIPVPALSVGGTARHNGSTAFTVRGGRHTLAVRLDPTDLIEEERESDNGFGAQWVFQPANLALDSPLVRAIPPDPQAGLDEITVTVTPGDGVGEGGQTVISPAIYPNCDGMRLPTVIPVGELNRWIAIAAMPGSKSNVDLGLYEASSGPSNGFAEGLASSNWSEGLSDFVLVNQRKATPRTYDAGMFRQGTGLESYTLHATGSTSLGISPAGTFGPFTLGAQRIVALHEAWLDEGPWTLELKNLSGNVDWGVSVHAPFIGDDTYFQGKGDALPGASTSLGTAGMNEMLEFSVPQAASGYYCIAVWKTGSDELPKSGDYSLEIHFAATGVGNDLPLARLGQLEVSPNPFNPRTEIHFELGQKSAVQIEVLNERGSRVRSLLSAELPAGPHEIVFDGVDDRGRPLSSGVYFVQLRAGKHGREVQKVVLLK